MKKMRFQWAALAVSAAVLTACGGGDDGSTVSNNTTMAAEGFWEASLSNGEVVDLVVLENGETWGVYTNSNDVIVEAFNGKTTVSGGNVQGSIKSFDFVDQITSDVTFSGSVKPKSNLSVSASYGVNFQATYATQYDQPALLSNIAGYFSGAGRSGNGAAPNTSVNIEVDGTFSADVGLNCTASGAVSPRASGKNVFDISATFSGLGCALGNGTTTTGVAYYDTVDQTLLVLALNAAKTDGFIYAGLKGTAPR